MDDPELVLAIRRAFPHAPVVRPAVDERQRLPALRRSRAGRPDRPGGPGGTSDPGGPEGPRGPRFSALDDRSRAASEPSLTLAEVTALFLSSRVPMLLRATAYDVPPSAMNTAMVDMTFA